MNYLNGNTLKELREKKNMTQSELADRIAVGNKAVSKWENGRGMPDISILPDLARELQISIPELLADQVISNSNHAANMKKLHFYVCPICGNVIQSIGEGAFSCHGILLPQAEPEEADEVHHFQVEVIEHEYHVSMQHPMDKNHYISFLAYVTTDQVQMKKLYPEQAAECRFTRYGHGYLYAYCNRHGLYTESIPSKRLVN